MISSFTGKYRFLSNFWFSPVMLDGVGYPTVEHAYQAAKRSDPVYRQWIHDARTPGAAKRRGKGKERNNWRKINRPIMKGLVRQKFEEADERLYLLATHQEELVEGNDWHDVYWGVCNGKCRQGPHEPFGQNELGKILMEVRNEIMEDTLIC